MTETTGRLDRGNGIELAWIKLEGNGPTVVFLPGFRSDMTGDKATALAGFCAEQGAGDAALRLLRTWRQRGRFPGWHHRRVGGGRDGGDRCSDEGQVMLVGSSMGGWIALLTAVARPAQRVAGWIGIAAAPDFTQRLMWDSMMPPERATLEREEVLYVPSQYGDPTPITRTLIEDGRTTRFLPATFRSAVRCGCYMGRPIWMCRGNCPCRSPNRWKRPRCAGCPGKGRRPSSVATGGPCAVIANASRPPRAGWRVGLRDNDG